MKLVYKNVTRFDEFDECAKDVRRDADVVVVVVDRSIDGDVGTHRSAQLLVRFSGLDLDLWMRKLSCLQ